MINKNKNKNNKQIVSNPRKMTQTEKNNRIYKQEWLNVPFNSPGPVDCEYEHPITGKCMSHYDYQVWINQHRK